MYPIMNEAMNPYMYVISNIIELYSKIVAPMIAGITNKNENVINCFLSKPNNNPVDIVAPDLEIPGIIASACESPIIIESFNEISFFPCENLVNINNNPVINNEIPTAFVFVNKEDI